jgi:hypothetical protein
MEKNKIYSTKIYGQRDKGHTQMIGAVDKFKAIPSEHPEKRK